MRTAYVLCLVASALVGAGVPGVAQQSATGQPATALRTQGQEVTLPVTVLDKHGKLVSGLTASDFTLTDNGQAQSIMSFTQQSSKPFQLGLLVDTSAGMLNVMGSERTAAEKFVGLMLPADPQNAKQGNEAFLVHFDREVELLQDFTNSATRLDKQLEGMGPSAQERNNPQGPDTMGGANGGNGQPTLRGGMVGNSTLYDAIYLASAQLMKTKHGRKALVVFSDGVDKGSIETLNEAVDAAQRANVAIYTVYFRGKAAISRSSARARPTAAATVSRLLSRLLPLSGKLPCELRPPCTPSRAWRAPARVYPSSCTRRLISKAVSTSRRR